MIDITKTEIFDGDDEIIFSETFNVYNSSFKIMGIMGLNFNFNFEDNNLNSGKDIDIKGDGNTATITFSSKIRNSLGSGTMGKVELGEMASSLNKQKLLFSLFANKIGDKSPGLNLSVTFYLRKI